MAIPMRQDQQQDADAVYVRDRIANADRLEAEGKAEEQSGSTKRKQAEQERIQAGLRLIEVRNNIPQDNKPSGGKPGRPISPFQEWLRKNDIAESTARSLMKLAGSDEEQRDEQRKKERDRKREERSKTRSIGWRALLVERLGITQGTLDNKPHRALMVEKFGALPKNFKDPSEEADAFVQEYLTKIGLPENFKREQLPKSSEEKVQRAICVETAKLNQSYHDEVEKGIKAQLADRIAHLESLREKVASRIKRYEIMLAGITPIITKEDYRFLLNTLHSDRIPTPEKMDKAFNIVKKMEPYIEAQA